MKAAGSPQPDRVAFFFGGSDLWKDRKAFREEINDHNEAEAIPRGVLFRSAISERDACLES